MVTNREQYEMERDREIASNYRAFAEQRDRIRREYAGHFVAFAFERVVASGPEIEPLIEFANQMDPVPGICSVFAAEDEPVFEVVESISSWYPAE